MEHAPVRRNRYCAHKAAGEQYKAHTTQPGCATTCMTCRGQIKWCVQCKVWGSATRFEQIHAHPPPTYADTLCSNLCDLVERITISPGEGGKITINGHHTGFTPGATPVPDSPEVDIGSTPGSPESSPLEPLEPGRPETSPPPVELAPEAPRRRRRTDDPITGKHDFIKQWWAQGVAQPSAHPFLQPPPVVVSSMEGLYRQIEQGQQVVLWQTDLPIPPEATQTLAFLATPKVAIPDVEDKDIRHTGPLKSAYLDTLRAEGLDAISTEGIEPLTTADEKAETVYEMGIAISMQGPEASMFSGLHSHAFPVHNYNCTPIRPSCNPRWAPDKLWVCVESNEHVWTLLDRWQQTEPKRVDVRSLLPFFEANQAKYWIFRQPAGWSLLFAPGVAHMVSTPGPAMGIHHYTPKLLVGKWLQLLSTAFTRDGLIVTGMHKELIRQHRGHTDQKVYLAWLTYYEDLITRSNARQGGGTEASGESREAGGAAGAVMCATSAAGVLNSPGKLA